MITLRPYQEDNAQHAAELLRTRRMAYLAMEVRTGKTLTAFRAVQLLGSPSCLFITKKKAIASIEADAQAIGVACTVTNYEQVPKLKQRSWGIVIIDEAHACLLGDTLVDGIKIKDIDVGRVLNTVNLATGQVEKKVVLNVIKNPLIENLVRIKADGKEIVCTEGHKVLTSEGWKRAGDITTGDEVCTFWMQQHTTA